MVSDFEVIFNALHSARVRYLTVGGVAVVLHGSPRFTADLDLVVELEEENLKLAIGALTALGYRPRAPVPLSDFAVPAKRREWIETKRFRQAVWKFGSGGEPLFGGGLSSG